jgi:hypothetical protein
LAPSETAQAVSAARALRVTVSSAAAAAEVAAEVEYLEAVTEGVVAASEGVVVAAASEEEAEAALLAVDSSVETGPLPFSKVPNS